MPKVITHVQQNIGGTAAGLSGIPAGAKRVRLHVDGGNIRYRTDGTEPTTAVGELLKADNAVKLFPPDLSDISIIEETADAKVSLTYESYT